MVKHWVEKKVRRHLVRAREGKGHGWTRWSSEWLYERLGLFNDYRLYRWSGTKAVPARYVTQPLILSKQERPVREICTLGATRRGLETNLRFG